MSNTQHLNKSQFEIVRINTSISRKDYEFLRSKGIRLNFAFEKGIEQIRDEYHEKTTKKTN